VPTIVGRRARAMKTMFRFDRFFWRLLPLWAGASLLHLGCTLITDVDRSKIPAPAEIEPDPEPTPADAGGENPAQPEAVDAGDAGSLADAAPELDASPMESPDAQADGG